VAIAFANGGKETNAAFSGTVKKVTFGAEEYVWHPAAANSYAEPDGPPKRGRVEWKPGQKVILPKASVTVLSGRVSGL